MFGQPDRYRLVIKRQLHGMMRDALGGEPVASAGTVNQVNRCLFQDAGPDPRQHIILGLAFKDDVIDPGKIEKTTKKQA